MTVRQYREMTEKQKREYLDVCAARGNYAALGEISVFEKYLDKSVKVTSGRKVPVGTVGMVFWVGMVNYSKYGNWWSWEARVGIRTDNGETHFTSERNIELIQ